MAWAGRCRCCAEIAFVDAFSPRRRTFALPESSLALGDRDNDRLSSAYPDVACSGEGLCVMTTGMGRAPAASHCRTFASGKEKTVLRSFTMTKRIESRSADDAGRDRVASSCY
jgi:hypothetical protein